ncbi:hypothetical protein O1611_g2229 [Lasiodiplodia mahajangana]|uniref:Uncharacterized protein n=1 Tax=Lasiodiplodia mahajangana TaxID=1108764 RepID=A0ACC2JVU9_9PEZI|nr:hypothetical protein O1611_g2229 [Lasiodiplodia mahajangana]
MDYGRPYGHENNVTLGIAMHRPQKAKGAIFMYDGNPGGSDPVVVLAWEMALNLTQTFKGLEDYDLMMMDVRGTYSSNPLNVSLETFNNLPLSYPQNETEFETYRQASATMFQSWIDSSSPPGIIGHVGTQEVVQDFEQIRTALGYDKVSFIGLSYGTYRAQQYAATFPSRVDKLVLDAIVPHGRALCDKSIDDIKALNRAVLRADAYCRDSDSCPLNGQGEGSVPRAIKNIIRQTRDQMIQGVTDGSDVIPVPAVQSVLASQFSGDPDFAAFTASLEMALAGNLSSFLESAPLTVESVVALPLECGDFPYNEYTYEEFKSSYDGAISLDETGIGRTAIWQLQLYCSGWPFHVKPEVPQPIAKPTVVMAADFDFDAPIEWSLSDLTQLDLDLVSFVVRHGDGHTSFAIPNEPFGTIGKNFLRTGKRPSPASTPLYRVFPSNSINYTFPNPYDVPFSP